MIARLLVPLALLGGAAQAQMASRDVPPPRSIQPVGLVSPHPGGYGSAAYRETPAVLYGSIDRYVPVVMHGGALPACRTSALLGMIHDDDIAGFDGDDFGDEFADAAYGDMDDDFGR